MAGMASQECLSLNSCVLCECIVSCFLVFLGGLRQTYPNVAIHNKAN